MQLVAYGAQDIYLTGNPQITFFKVVYRRHTNFSMEAIEQTWNGSATGQSRCSATISRNGDLVSRMYLEVGGSPASAAGSTALRTTANPGSSFIKSVELEIGGQKIDKQSGFWMECFAELTEPNPGGCGGIMASTGNATGPYDPAVTVGQTKFQAMAGMGGIGAPDVTGNVTGTMIYTVPLNFWFCKNPGLALPLIALQYHEVKVYLDHNHGEIFGVTSPINNLWCDYIYLDTDERRRFAQVSHEYLIEQVQEQSLEEDLTNQLNFNHPVKELIWAAHSDAAGERGWTQPLVTRTAAANVRAVGTGVDATWQLKLNGHDRFAARRGSYFSRTQVWQHHSGFGGMLPDSEGLASLNDSISVYSFALKPEEHQPSGTCNFSRIDNASLVSGTVVAANTVCFAVNYNVLRIMSGMGGLAYSN